MLDSLLQVRYNNKRKILVDFSGFGHLFATQLSCDSCVAFCCLYLGSISRMEDYICMEKKFLSLIKTRRSVRTYKSEPVLSKALDVVLEAGTYAPTGGRHQSPTIIAITDSKYRRAIALDYPAQEAGQPAARKQNYIVRTICGEEGKHADQ